MTPILLQRGPEILKYLDELLILVFMVAGALTPAIRQARERKKAEERRQRASKPVERPVPAAAAEAAARRHDLEERVRAYFEQRTAPPPPPPPAPVVVAPERLGAEFEAFHVDLSRASVVGAAPATSAAPPLSGVPRHRSRPRSPTVRGIHRALTTSAELRRAIVLREVLGPPKGLEDLPR